VASCRLPRPPAPSARTVGDGLAAATKRVPGVRSLLESPPAHRLREARLAARPLHGALGFVLREQLRAQAAPRAGRYRLRASGLTVFIRHRTRDLYILKEVFGNGAEPGGYEPPAALAAMLEETHGPSVLDLGGNIGLFGAFVIGRWPGATVHSFEPDPMNLQMLQRVISANDLQQRWTVTAAAVAAQDGTLEFVSGLYAESQIAGLAGESDRGPAAAALTEGRTILVAAVDLFAQDHDVALIKIDIEGGEWPILSDPRLADLQARAIVLEWHAAACPESNARDTAVGLLAAAGYTGLHESEDFGYRGLLWAWREPVPG
jgi:FkbM family methyltransferase